MHMQIKGRLKSRELADKICELIVDNGLKPGDQILSELKLADKFNLSRVTVRQSIAGLVDQDILLKVKGKGTFVSKLNNLTSQNDKQNGLKKTIVMVIRSICSSYYGNIARGIEHAAKEKGFHVSFYSTNGSVSEEEQGIRKLLKSGVGGIIISPVESNPMSPFMQRTCKEYDNIVIINDVILGFNIDIVSSDDVLGGYLATTHLLEQGHRRIAHLHGSRLTMSADSREAGYKKALREFGITPNQNLILGQGTYSQEEAYSNTLKLMQLSKSERPTAIFAASDDMALGVYQAAEELGLSIPQEIALVGYGNLAKMAQDGYQLSTVNQNGHEIGYRSCKILLDNILNPTLERSNHHKRLIPPELIIRASSLNINKKEQRKQEHCTLLTA